MFFAVQIKIRSFDFRRSAEDSNIKCELLDRIE